MMTMLSAFVALLSITSSDVFVSAKRNDVFNDDITVDYSYLQFVQKYDKQYDPKRREIFYRNKAKVREHNNANEMLTNPKTSTYEMEINFFADMLENELPLGYDKSLSSTRTRTEHAAAAKTSSLLSIERSLGRTTPEWNENLPDALDWRVPGDVTTPIKNQGGCGSCWAFASIAALESHIAIETGKLFSLSMQELVSCVPNPRQCGGKGGCLGSTSELAYDFVAKHGIVDEWRFGYQSYSGKNITCTILDGGKNLRGPTDDDNIRGAVASIVGFARLPTNHYHALMYTVATMGPVVVSVAASGWGLYKGGIYNDDDAETRDINHAVVLEGYGTDEETGEDYWLIRNSWGPLWGEDGYIRLKRVDPSTLDDPSSDCKLDETPADGTACQKDDEGHDITPQSIQVCGTSGVLSDSVIPVGGHLL